MLAQWMGLCYTSQTVPGGNNSVVECDLAKVEVAGSNPVSRSNFRLFAAKVVPLKPAPRAKADDS